MAIISLLIATALGGSLDTFVKSATGKTATFDAKCKKDNNKIELWTSTTGFGAYSLLSVTSADGFMTAVKTRSTTVKEGDEKGMTAERCTARYKFFRVTHKCNGTLYRPTQYGSDYGKIDQWQNIQGPADCANTPAGTANTWTVCSTSIKGMPGAQICLYAYYGPKPMTVTNAANESVPISPNQIKFDVELLGLDAVTCPGTSTFGLAVRGNTKNKVVTKGADHRADAEVTTGGTPCKFGFLWAPGVLVDGKAKAVGTDGNVCGSCSVGEASEEKEPDDSEAPEKTCCQFDLADGSAKHVVWDPSVEVNGVRPVAAMLALLVAAVVAML